MDSNDKLFGVLSYIGILWLVGLLASKTEFARFHVNQGLVLWILSIAAGIVGGIIAFIPIIGWIIGGLLWLVDLAAFVLAIIGIVNAVSGEMKELPIIGKFRIVK